MIRFGGPVFLKDGKNTGDGYNYKIGIVDPAVLAEAHRAKGYTSAYAPSADIRDTVGIAAFRKAFEKEGVMIAEVGYWQNILDTDPDTRRKNRGEMVDALALAEELGAQCAVNILGSFCHGHGAAVHSSRNFSEEAFEEAVDMARSFIDAVKPKTAFFTYEIFPFSVIDSPQMIYELIKAVDRRQFGVHMDLANLIKGPREYWRSGELIRECVRLFGDRIVSAHVKDIKMKEPAISVILEEVQAGHGMIDLAAFIKEMHGLKREIPFMMEHLSNEQEYDKAAGHIRQIAAGEGIRI